MPGGISCRIFRAGRGVAVAKHFEVGEADPGEGRIRRNLPVPDGNRLSRQTNPARKGNRRPRRKCILRSRGSRSWASLISGERFPPASLPAVNSGDVMEKVGLVRRGRRRGGELLERGAIILIHPVEGKAECDMSFAQVWRQPNRFFRLAARFRFSDRIPLHSHDGALYNREARMRECEPGIQRDRLLVKVLRSRPNPRSSD